MSRTLYLCLLIFGSDIFHDICRPSSDEGWGTTLVQIGLPFLVAGLGMVAAGLVLDDVQHWPVFLEVPELFILVPALLGLKVSQLCFASLCAVNIRRAIGR